MKSDSLTAFSWGYWGWGTTVPRFLEAAAAAEAARGFAPPAFADVRFKRSVRAPGFQGSALEMEVGAERYRWFRRLGNEAIDDGEPDEVRIADPSESEALLDYVEQQGAAGRRVIFFCACPAQREGDRVTCHRWEVGDLLLGSARRRGTRLTVVEWPGGEPDTRELKLPPGEALKSATIPLGTKLPAGGLATLPWFSVVRVRVGAEAVAVLSGPAEFSRGRWRLPVRELPASQDDDGWRALPAEASVQRERFGLNARTSW